MAVGAHRTGATRSAPPRRAVAAAPETRLERGEYLEALSELDSLTDEYPLDERLCGQRMLAAYRAGRQAEALRAFQQLRRNLAQELGSRTRPGARRARTPAARSRPDAARGRPRAPGTGLDHEVAARAGGRSGAASDQVTEYTDALRSIRASSQLQLGLATVAVLITDLVGSASMRTSLGDHRADEIERWHETIVTKAVADYQGTIVKRLGDGAMAIFTTATDAIAAARRDPDPARAREPDQGRRDARAHRHERGRSRGRGERRARAAADGSRAPVARAEGGQILTTATRPAPRGRAQRRVVPSVRRVRV